MNELADSLVVTFLAFPQSYQGLHHIFPPATDPPWDGLGDLSAQWESKKGAYIDGRNYFGGPPH